MTRTILNWSELLDRYQSESDEEPKRLKKWSEIGEPERKKPIPEISEPGEQIRSVHETIVDINSQPTQIHDLEHHDNDINERTERTESLDFETGDKAELFIDDNEEDNLEDLFESDQERTMQTPKATILELFYDCLMLDSETIPALYAEYCDKSDNNGIVE